MSCHFAHVLQLIGPVDVMGHDRFVILSRSARPTTDELIQIAAMLIFLQKHKFKVWVLWLLMNQWSPTNQHLLQWLRKSHRPPQFSNLLPYFHFQYFLSLLSTLTVRKIDVIFFILVEIIPIGTLYQLQFEIWSSFSLQYNSANSVRIEMLPMTNLNPYGSSQTKSIWLNILSEIWNDSPLKCGSTAFFLYVKDFAKKCF